jgi:multimeric flavodoxin WrbA
MCKDILLLSGSPRRGGSTDKLAEAFVRGAESEGKKVSCFRPADMKINGCLGCDHCKTVIPGICAQTDDMQAIIDALRVADAFVFASPIYYYDFTAQLKTAIDRCYQIHHEKLRIKKTALLLTCAEYLSDEEPLPGCAEGLILMYRINARHFKWEDAGIVAAGGLYHGKTIDGRPELERARLLGRRI